MLMSAPTQKLLFLADEITRARMRLVLVSVSTTSKMDLMSEMNWLSITLTPTNSGCLLFLLERYLMISASVLIVFSPSDVR